MRMLFRRIIGILLIITAIISLLVSLFFLTQIWRLRQPLTNRLVENLELLYATTATTEDSLLLVESTITDLLDAIGSLQTTTISVAQSIHDTGILADSFATIVGDDFPDTITDTQTAIASAQASAVVIDNVLNALASIPLIGIDYNPPLPLNLALGQVSDSLSSMPPALDEIQLDLETAHANLIHLEETIITINQHLQKISGNLVLAQDVIDEYQEEINQLKQRLDHSRTSAPGWITTTAWVLTFIIAWLSISQIGLLLQGLDALMIKQ